MLARYRFPVAVGCTFALLVVTWGTTAWGQFPVRGGEQRRPMQKRPPDKPATVEAAGTIEAIAAGRIQIKTITGQPWLLVASRETKIRVTGTAKKDVLGRGSFIRFTAEVDKRRSQVQGEVAKLTIFTPSPERGLGVFPDQGGPDMEALATPFGLEAPKAKPTGKRRPTRNQDAGPAIESFEIAGQIAGVSKDGKLTVFVPRNRYLRPPLEVTIAEAPEIELDVAGPKALMLAKKGDQVEARGRQVGPAASQVMELTIQLAEPWTTVRPKKVPRRQSTRSHRTRTDEAKDAVEAEKGEEPEEPVEAEKTEGPEEPVEAKEEVQEVDQADP